MSSYCRILMLLAGLLWTCATSPPLDGQDVRPKFEVVAVYPGNKTQEVELEPLIQIHVSEKFDPSTVSEDSVELRVRGSSDTIEINVGGDLGGVITVSVPEPLKRDTEYELAITGSLKSRDGVSMDPMSVRFRTTAKASAPPRSDIADFRFTRQQLDRRDGVVGLTLLKDRLFACTWDGKLLAYPLNDDGTLHGPPNLLHAMKRRFNAIVVDPTSTSDRVILWLSHDSQHELSLGPNDYSGAIAKVTMTDAGVTFANVVVGLPTGDHPASGLTFGPDGRLYVSQGALSMLGGKAEVPETPLSAATLAIDVTHAIWNQGHAVDVRDYSADTNPAALQVFATGIREAFDLCWHSVGRLFAGVNMNDTNEKTPGKESLPAVNVRPAEMMLRIEEGKYYGHPNPSRNEWVLLGGNPTAEADPWEVTELPVGTKPEANFDPSLFLRNLEADKGPSADGVCEWTSEGPLRGRLLFCFYTATRGIHSYRVVADGLRVDDPQPLVGTDNRILRFGAPLDIVHDPRGWLYVADFSAPQRGDSGTDGGVWLVKPAGGESSLSRSEVLTEEALTDEELLEKVQRQTFNYFYDFAHPDCGMARERSAPALRGTTGHAQLEHIVTTGGTGFGLMAFPVAVERQWITREAAVNRLLKIVRFLQRVPRFHGMWAHWYRGDTGAVRPFSRKDNGGDIVESSFLLQGLLTVRQYFDRATPEEQQLRAMITRLWHEADWTWYTQGKPWLYWHWSPDFGFEMNMPIMGFDECMIVYVLAVASPTHAVKPDLYDSGWAVTDNNRFRGQGDYVQRLKIGNGNSGGPLFFTHYSYLGMSPFFKDRYITQAGYEDYADRHRAMVEYCIRWCRRKGYPRDCWGLTSSDDPEQGYKAHSADDGPRGDNGTITPSAALSSIVYTPEESLAFLRYLWANHRDGLWSDLGFHDAFHLERNWYAPAHLAIDQGPIIVMIENYRTGKPWKWFMAIPEIGKATKALGFEATKTP